MLALLCACDERARGEAAAAQGTAVRVSSRAPIAESRLATQKASYGYADQAKAWPQDDSKVAASSKGSELNPCAAPAVNATPSQFHQSGEGEQRERAQVAAQDEALVALGHVEELESIVRGLEQELVNAETEKERAQSEAARAKQSLREIESEMLAWVEAEQAHAEEEQAPVQAQHQQALAHERAVLRHLRQTYCIGETSTGEGIGKTSTGVGIGGQSTGDGIGRGSTGYGIGRGSTGYGIGRGDTGVGASPVGD